MLIETASVKKAEFKAVELNSVELKTAEIKAAELLTTAQCSGHRGMLVLAGGVQWCYRSALNIVDALPESTVTWVGDAVAPLADNANDIHNPTDSKAIVRVASSEARSLLGTDSQALVLDARSGLSPDTLGIISGTLRGGALLVLLTPPLNDWPDFDDPDYQRYQALRPVVAMQSGDHSVNHVTSGYRFSEHQSPGQQMPGYKMSGNFIRRFIRFIRTVAINQHVSENQFLALIDEPDASAQVISLSPSNSELPQGLVTAAPIKPSKEQQHVVDSLVGIMARRRACVVLEADRGRGKTVALGFAVLKLLARGYSNIIVTAALRSSVNNLFTVLEQNTGLATDTIRFCAVDQLVADAAAGEQPRCELLLVDEAAAIPLPILAQLATSAQRVVFATTVHGYEGSGRGFALRFKAQLTNRFDPFVSGEFQFLRLSQPMRWAVNDPMESFFNRLLVLDCGTSFDCKAPVDYKDLIDGSARIDQQADNGGESITTRPVATEELLANEALLRAVFGLLVDAHYQTRPSDLRQLLDAPFLKLWVAESTAGNSQKNAEKTGGNYGNWDGEKTIVGVCLACEEGGFSLDSSAAENTALLAAIAAGQRRPQGNLLAQSLTLLSADTGWCEMRSLRIMRIAVAGHCRRQRIASQLVATLQNYCQQQGYDYWGSSFGFEPGLLVFWTGLAAVPVQMGLRSDKASGMRNLMVVKPLSGRASSLCATRAESLLHDLPYWAMNYLPESEVTLLVDVLTKAYIEAAALPDKHFAANHAQPAAAFDRWVLNRFIKGEIPYDKAYPALCRQMQRLLEPSKPVTAANALALAERFGDTGGKRDSDKNAALLVVSLALAPDWTKLARQFGLTGRRDAIKAIKTALIRLGGH